MPIVKRNVQAPGRRNSRVVIPEGNTFDIVELLEATGWFRVRTVDNILISIKETTSMTVDSRRDIVSHLEITIEFMGTRKIFDGWCQRYFTIWKQVDPLRRGLRWRFGYMENCESELESGAVCIRQLRSI